MQPAGRAAVDAAQGRRPLGRGVRRPGHHRGARRPRRRDRGEPRRAGDVRGAHLDQPVRPGPPAPRRQAGGDPSPQDRRSSWRCSPADETPYPQKARPRTDEFRRPVRVSMDATREIRAPADRSETAVTTPTLTSLMLSSTDPERLHTWYTTVLPPADRRQAGPVPHPRLRRLLPLPRHAATTSAAKTAEPGRVVLNFDVDDARAVAGRVDDARQPVAGAARGPRRQPVRDRDRPGRQLRPGDPAQRGAPGSRWPQRAEGVTAMFKDVPGIQRLLGRRPRDGPRVLRRHPRARRHRARREHGPAPARPGRRRHGCWPTPRATPTSRPRSRSSTSRSPTSRRRSTRSPPRASRSSGTTASTRTTRGSRGARAR